MSSYDSLKLRNTQNSNVGSLVAITLVFTIVLYAPSYLVVSSNNPGICTHCHILNSIYVYCSNLSFFLKYLFCWPISPVNEEKSILIKYRYTQYAHKHWIYWHISMFIWQLKCPYDFLPVVLTTEIMK